MFCSYILITIKHEKLHVHTFVVATSMVQNIAYCQQQESCEIDMAGAASFDYLDVINSIVKVKTCTITFVIKGEYAQCGTIFYEKYFLISLYNRIESIETSRSLI